MSIKTASIPTIDVGTPSNEFLSHDHDSTDWETITFRIHGFEDLPVTTGYRVYSSIFSCFEHQWKLYVCPGGEASSKEGMVAMGLNHMSTTEITNIRYGFLLKDKDNRGKMDKCCLGERKFGPRDPRQGSNNCWSMLNFAKRSYIISNLVGGSLIVEVQLRRTNDSAQVSMPFIPDNSLPKTILSKFLDEKTADVVFEVGGVQAKRSQRKVAKTSTTFHAHSFILQNWAPALEGLWDKPTKDAEPIPISDVKPDIFHHLLYYSYGGKVDDGDLEANAKDIIDAANKYGVVGLKLEAEAKLVTSSPITMDNVMDNLLYSDATNCPLLKEAVMDFLVNNAEEGIKKLSFQDVPGHIVKDVLTAVAMGKKDDNATNDDLSKARVSTLRKMLHEKGLDVDGSREMMIARLEQNSSNDDGD